LPLTPHPWRTPFRQTFLDEPVKVKIQIVSKKAFHPAVLWCFGRREPLMVPRGQVGIYNSPCSLFIFFCGKENEPKETARVPGPCGLPCASRSRRALWNSLALRQPQGL
jgi:hypothetical protein